MKQNILKILIVAVGIVGVVLIIHGMIYGGELRKTEKKIEKENPTYSEEEITEDFKELSSKMEKYDAKDAKGNIDEGSALENFEERHFSNLQYSIDYDCDGEYIGKTDMEKTKEMYPVYCASWISDNNEAWTLFIINGKIYAYPVSYTLSENSTAPLIISETDYLIGYDGPSNKFFKYLPKKEEVVLKKVKHIDAELLNKLTVEKLQEYVKENVE